jgi:hypothetical protein
MEGETPPELQDDNPFDEGMKKLVISMSPDRQSALDYGHEVISGMPYEQVPAHIKKNFSIKYNEHRKNQAGKNVPPAYDINTNLWTSLPDLPDGKQPRGRMGCFGAHCRALQYVAENKIDNVAILEDDAQIDRKSMGIRAGETFDTSYFPQDAPTLLGGTFRHPKAWNQDKKWRKEVLPKLTGKFQKGINPVNYDEKRWTQSHAIYYPKWEVARDTLKKIEQIGHENKSPLGAGPYKHYDIFMGGDSRLIPYFHYPSLFTHNDGIDKNRNPKAVGGGIGKGEGIVKNYINMGKKPKDIVRYTEPYEWKNMMKATGKGLSAKQHRQRSK